MFAKYTVSCGFEKLATFTVEIPDEELEGLTEEEHDDIVREEICKHFNEFIEWNIEDYGYAGN